jgi:hypothetical protein
MGWTLRDVLELPVDAYNVLVEELAKLHDED